MKPQLALVGGSLIATSLAVVADFSVPRPGNDGPRAPAAVMPLGATPALVWGDYNGDGLLDLFVASKDTSARLLVNEGGGNFSDATAESGLLPFAGSRFAAGQWKDYDGDGRLDLLALADGPGSRLFHQGSDGIFVDQTRWAGLPADANVLSASWLDYDADGRPDLHVLTPERERVFRNAGAGHFEEVDVGVVATGAGNGSSGANAGLSAACANTLIDQISGLCTLEGSSTPTLNMLYPLTQNLFVAGLTGHVGIGTLAPGERLTVAGVVHSTAGGYRFPDGTLQTTAQVQGPAGPTGPQGPAGATGPTGAQGLPGPTGPAGSTGPQGLAGPTGPQGLAGPTGPQGLPGPAGADGATGPQGPAGVPGATGPTGTQGPMGLPGPTGPTGAPGSADAWSRLGNAGTVDGTNYMGTSDNVAVELRVNALRGLRIEPTATAPNLIGGSPSNTVNGGVAGATIGGGQSNTVTGGSGTVSGGQTNAAALNAVVAGGNNNAATQNSTVVSGGLNNAASGLFSTISGGQNNLSSGNWSVVLAGSQNEATASYAYAAGRRANAVHAGSFVWGDSTNTAVTSNVANSVTFQASGGARLFSNSAGTTGVEMAAGGGSWSSLSDRAAKENVQPVDGRAILERLASIPIATWNYISQDEAVRHMGPMAQDFYAAFGLGESEKRIATIDPDGVALAAIQGLHEIVKEREAELSAQRSEIDELRRELEILKAMIADKQ